MLVIVVVGVVLISFCAICFFEGGRVCFDVLLSSLSMFVSACGLCICFFGVFCISLCFVLCCVVDVVLLYLIMFGFVCVLSCLLCCLLLCVCLFVFVSFFVCV